MCDPAQRRTGNPEFVFASKLFVSLTACGLIFFLAEFARAGSATWDLDPISGDWNTAANWTPDSVPNGPADIATFGLSNATDVFISADTQVNGIIFTPAAANEYSIFVSELTISGVGIKNNSGISHTFLGGQIRFTNSSTAGNAFINDSSSTNFFDKSTAGNSTITTHFHEVINFFDGSTAGSARLVGEEGGFVNFFDRSTAGSAQISFPGFGVGAVSFFDNSTAGSASISILEFGSLHFADNSRGGTARIELTTFGNSTAILDISAHNAPGVTIGSLEGNETAIVSLGANNLTIGSNNLSTTFSGVIQDGGQNGGSGGSLTKIGSGTLILSGANTYTGDTNINRGVLQVDGSITSNTFVNRRGTLAGIGTIQGDVTNAGGTVTPGGPLGSLTVTGNYTQQASGTLLINIAGEASGQFSLLSVLGNADLSGALNPVLLNGFIPAVGDSFIFLDYASVSGSLFIPDRNIDDVMEHWLVTYFPDHAVLTVAAGNVSVPDEASTLLLMTLSLVALLGLRANLRRS